MRNLARNMSFMIKAIADGKHKTVCPKMNTNILPAFPTENKIFLEVLL